MKDKNWNIEDLKKDLDTFGVMIIRSMEYLTTPDFVHKLQLADQMDGKKKEEIIMFFSLTDMIIWTLSYFIAGLIILQHERSLTKNG